MKYSLTKKTLLVDNKEGYIFKIISVANDFFIHLTALFANRDYINCRPVKTISSSFAIDSIVKTFTLYFLSKIISFAIYIILTSSIYPYRL